MRGRGREDSALCTLLCIPNSMIHGMDAKKKKSMWKGEQMRKERGRSEKEKRKKARGRGGLQRVGE